MFFFFSSRRRHTRSYGDWSSDVCSSDLQVGAWSFKSPHVARHTAATTLLEVTGGDVRLVQEVLGHANLNTLQGYTKIVDSRKQEAYRLYQAFLDGKKKVQES